MAAEKLKLKTNPVTHGTHLRTFKEVEARVLQVETWEAYETELHTRRMAWFREEKERAQEACGVLGHRIVNLGDLFDPAAEKRYCLTCRLELRHAGRDVRDSADVRDRPGQPGAGEPQADPPGGLRLRQEHPARPQGDGGRDRLLGEAAPQGTAGLPAR